MCENQVQQPFRRFGNRLAALYYAQGARGDGRVQHQAENRTVFQRFRGEVPHHAAHAEISLDKPDDQVAGRQLKFRLKPEPGGGEEAVQVFPGAGVPLQEDQRQALQLPQGKGAAGQPGKAGTGDHGVLHLPNRGEGEAARIGDRLAHHPEVDGSLLESEQGFGGGAVGDADFNAGIEGVEAFEMGKKEKPQGHVARPHPDFAAFEVEPFLQLSFPEPELLHPGGHMFQQGFPFAGERHSLGGAEEETAVQRLLQLADAPADSRLGEVQLRCRKSDAFAAGDGIEYLIEIQADAAHTRNLPKKAGRARPFPPFKTEHIRFLYVDLHLYAPQVRVALQHRGDLLREKFGRLLRRTAHVAGRLQYAFQLRQGNAEGRVRRDALQQIVHAVPLLDAAGGLHRMDADALVQLLPVAAPLDAVHHDVFSGHKGQLPPQVAVDDGGVHHQPVHHVDDEGKEGVHCEEAFRHADPLVGGVVQGALEPLGGGGHRRVEGIRDHVSGEGGDPLAAHRVALVRHGGGADLALFKRLLDLLEVLEQPDVV